MPQRLDDLYHNCYIPLQLPEIKSSVEDNHKILIDHLSKEDIFTLCSEGRGPSQIAKQLTKEQIINPSNRYFHLNGVALTNLNI